MKSKIPQKEQKRVKTTEQIGMKYIKRLQYSMSSINVTFVNDYLEVINCITHKYASINTRMTYLAHVIGYIREDPGGNEILFEKYRKQHSL